MNSSGRARGNGGGTAPSPDTPVHARSYYRFEYELKVVAVDLSARRPVSLRFGIRRARERSPCRAARHDRGSSSIRRKVQKLLQLGEEAVRALGEIDAALYLREDGEEQLQIVADAVLSHFRRLLEYVVMVAPAAAARRTTADVELELDGSAPARKSGPISTRGVIAAHRQRSDDDKWNALTAEMVDVAVRAGIRAQGIRTPVRTRARNDQKEQAVRDLNDATTGLMDGVFAVMTTVYECFLGYAEPERMVPGTATRSARRSRSGGPSRSCAAEYVSSTGAFRIVQRLPTWRRRATAHRRRDEPLHRQRRFLYLRSDTRRDFWQFRERWRTGTRCRIASTVKGSTSTSTRWRSCLSAACSSNMTLI